MSQSSEEVEAETGKERQEVGKRIVRSEDKDSALRFYTDQSTIFRYLQWRKKKITKEKQFLYTPLFSFMPKEFNCCYVVKNIKIEEICEGNFQWSW